MKMLLAAAMLVLINISYKYGVYSVSHNVPHLAGNHSDTMDALVQYNAIITPNSTQAVLPDKLKRILKRHSSEGDVHKNSSMKNNSVSCKKYIQKRYMEQREAFSAKKWLVITVALCCMLTMSLFFVFLASLHNREKKPKMIRFDSESVLWEAPPK